MTGGNMLVSLSAFQFAHLGACNLVFSSINLSNLIFNFVFKNWYQSPTGGNQAAYQVGG